VSRIKSGTSTEPGRSVWYGTHLFRNPCCIRAELAVADWSCEGISLYDSNNVCSFHHVRNAPAGGVNPSLQVLHSAII
jgi:hypothetical protein